MKIAALAFIPALFACSGTSPSVRVDASKLHTAATGRLVDDIKRDLAGDHNAFHPECAFERVVSAEPISKDAQATYETWSVEACSGKVFAYKVMIISGAGSNSVMISPLQQPQ